MWTAIFAKNRNLEIMEPWTVEILKSETLTSWNIEISKPWHLEKLNSWIFGDLYDILTSWNLNFEFLQYWKLKLLNMWALQILIFSIVELVNSTFNNIGILKSENIETLTYWNHDILNSWNPGLLKSWNLEILKSWDREVLKSKSLNPHPVYTHSITSSRFVPRILTSLMIPPMQRW